MGLARGKLIKVYTYDKNQSHRTCLNRGNLYRHIRSNLFCSHLDL